jgi:hypothetical protein
VFIDLILDADLPVNGRDLQQWDCRDTHVRTISVMAR